jgi:hypothetical protein
MMKTLFVLLGCALLAQAESDLLFGVLSQNRDVSLWWEDSFAETLIPELR